MKVLIAYATTEGQTRKIAEKFANQVHELGHVAELVDIDRKPHNINVDDFNTTKTQSRSLLLLAERPSTRSPPCSCP
jgi:flavodoxin